MSKYVLNNKKVVEIYLDPKWKKIGIFTSGGFDSSLLLYLFLEERKLQNLKIEFECFIVPKQGADKYAKRIIEKFESEYGKLSRIDNLDNKNVEGIIEPIKEMMDKSGYDQIFTGINSNPPPELCVLEGRYPVRTTVDSYKHLRLPFIRLYKNEIVELAYLTGFDKYIALTYSCTENDEQPCQKCFACQERKWAFEFNKIQDPIFKN